MTFGLEVKDSAARLVFGTAGGLFAGGVFVEVLTLPRGNSGSKVYTADPRYAGRSALVIQAGAGGHAWTRGTSGGYPSIAWTARANRTTYDSTLLVFIQ